ncbi:MAG: ABC transporter ATP-binding protein/permease, partial [Oscillospiraceae bacterium]|nr:ABC transporter ATP-binding protein/permease [Oscillospiraceae bacterium]
MKVLWRVAKEAVSYRGLLILAAISTLLLTGVNLFAPRLLTSMVSLVSKGLSQEGLKSIGLLTMELLGLYILKILFRFLSNYCAHKAAWNLVRNIRMMVYNTLQSFSMDYFRSKQTGDLMSRVMSDAATFELLYAHIMPETVTNAVTLIGVTVILFTINARLALMTCVPIPFILFSGWFFLKKVRPNFRVMQKSQGELSAQLQDNFSGIQEIQAFGQQKIATQKVHGKAEKFTVSMLKALRLSAVFHPSVEFLTSLGTVIVVGFGGLLAYRQQLSVSDIVAFLLYLSLFYAPITGLAQLLESAQQALAGAERVIEILDTPVNIKDRPGAESLGNVEGYIKFDHVSFSYIDLVPVLKDVCFEAKPGKMVALVGPTGVGKTTLTQLISRFYDPTEGSIYLAGKDLKDITLESLHRNISLVLQDTFLFNGTITENIAFAMPEATQEEIESAAKIARIHDDIMEMPNGYETQVGERGTKLSGGQKQRIAIARAVLWRAPILILDEATASVDVQTEAQIQQAIGEIAGTRTIIAIAHRLSTIRNADLILVFEEGRIVQRGTHETLIAEEGRYRDMWKIQE